MFKKLVSVWRRGFCDEFNLRSGIFLKGRRKKQPSFPASKYRGEGMIAGYDQLRLWRQRPCSFSCLVTRYISQHDQDILIITWNIISWQNHDGNSNAIITNSFGLSLPTLSFSGFLDLKLKKTSISNTGHWVFVCFMLFLVLSVILPLKNVVKWMVSG